MSHLIGGGSPATPPPLPQNARQQQATPKAVAPDDWGSATTKTMREPRNVEYLPNGQLSGILWRGYFLQIVTLFIYRFWFRTNLRRYYWSQTRLSGEGFEWTGTGKEMFLGWLIAMTFLVVWVALFNVLFSFFHLAIWQGHPAAGSLTLLVTFPLITYAYHKSVRYRLSRTRWRGIRMGLEGSSWAYLGFSLKWLLITMLTLGLTAPHAQWAQSRYLLTRARFGSLPMGLAGTLGRLYWFYIPMLLCLIAGIGLMVYGSLLADGTVGSGAGLPHGHNRLGSTRPEMNPEAMNYVFSGLGVLAVGGLLAALFRLRFIEALLNNLHIGGENGFRLRARLPAGRVIGLVIGGWVAAIAAGMMAFVALGMVMTAVIAVLAAGSGSMVELAKTGAISPSLLIALVILGLGYIAALSIVGLVWHLVTIQGTHAAVVNNIQAINVSALENAVQRDGDSSIEAEGFAEALDIGGL